MGRPREFDEGDVVNAAMHVFWQQGYRASSVEDLVQATGLERGSLYGAFGNKHGLLMQSLDAYTAQFLGRFDDLVRHSDDPVDALRDLIRRAGVDCKDGKKSRHGCLVGNTCTELAAHDPAVRHRVDGFLTTLRAAMADALRRGQSMGTFGSDRDPEAVAAFIQCNLQGLALLSKSRPGPQLIASVIDELLRALDQSQKTAPREATDPRTPQHQ